MAVFKKNTMLCSLCIFALCNLTYVVAGEELLQPEDGVIQSDMQGSDMSEQGSESTGDDAQNNVGDEASGAESVTEDESVSEDGKEAVPASETQHVSAEPEKEEGTENIKEDTKEEEPKIGIDTIHLPDPQGNWLFKRIWWEKAEKRYEKIRKYVDSVFESRPEFFIKRADIDKNILAPFYLEIGFGQGELKRIVDQLLDHLEQARSRKDGLTAEERKAIDALQQEENTLKQIRMDIEGIATACDQLDEDVNVLFGLIKQVRGYDREAWNSFKEIAVVLSDTKARELYYQMGNNIKNITNIQAYIRLEFTKHFNSLEAMVADKVGNVQELVEQLLDKGFDLREQLDQLNKKTVPCEIEKPEELAGERGEAGFFDNYIMQPISGLFSYISSSIKSLYERFSGEESQEEKEELSED